MTFTPPNIALKTHSLSRERLFRLKWTTIIAILGLPAVAQTLGAMMLFSESFPSLLSMPAILILASFASIVIGAGLYALSTRVFLRFAGAHQGLNEWEAKVSNDAQAFSYRVIAKGAMLSFIGASIMGVFQLLAATSMIDVGLPYDIGLNLPGMAVFTVVLTYVIILLPALYIAWTVPPLNDDCE
ncbi:MAG: hypothetical protein AAF437_03280 [Pseudomonadota bacterium]